MPFKLSSLTCIKPTIFQFLSLTVHVELAYGSVKVHGFNLDSKVNVAVIKSSCFNSNFVFDLDL